MTATARIGLFLFGSGFCALVYQIAWLRLLRLVFGGSTAASATVLAIFMAGLGAGGLWLGRRSQRVGNPLDFYARLEIGISIAAAASVFLIAGVRASYVALGGTATLGSLGGTALRLVLATIVLGLPTFLMGGTLPATVRAATSERDVGRHTVGLLYAVNTLGAVAGAWITTFYLIELLGIRQSIWLAAALNLLIAVAARAEARRMASAGAVATTDRDGTPVAASSESSRSLYYLVLAAAAGVGFVFFQLELVWYRMMAPILGGSTYTFGVVLAVALAGIGLGGFLYGLAAQGRRPTPAEFAATCSLEALAVAIPFAAGDRIAFLALQLRDLSVAGFGALTLGWTAVSVCVIFPAAVLAGYQFPLLIALLGSGRDEIASQVGRTYAWNTFGAILGSIAGGFLILPALGAPATWKLSIWLLGLIATAFLAYEMRHRRPALYGIGALALAAFALTTADGPTAFWRHSGIGAGRLKVPIRSPNDLEDMRLGFQRNVAWEADGRESSVALVQGEGYAFVVNGKVDGHSRSDAPTQVMSGLVATALHPEPKSTLVIGLGTGSTAGWMARVPTVESVEVVELEPAILRVAEDCAPVNEKVLENPKVEVVIADAREHLLTVKSSYDVVFSEPSNPYRAGVSSLFTQEFYEAVRERLTEKGLFVQWLQAYEVDAQVIRTAYATLSSVFEHVETWQVHRSDLLLIASNRAIDHSRPALAEVLRHEPYRKALDLVWGVRGVDGLYSGFLANAEFSRDVGALDLAAINTDDHPVIEFGFARSVGQPSDFSVQQLRQIATARGQNRPAAVSFDWDDVEDAREVRDLVLHGRPVEALASEDPERQARHRARDAHGREAYGEALDLWREQTSPPRHPRDLLAVADSAATAADPEFPELAQRLAETRPVEAGFARARWHLARNEATLALSAWLEAVETYRTNPWPEPQLVTRGLFLVWKLLEAAAQAPDLPDPTPVILEALSQPFSMRLLDHQRATTRLNLALRSEERSRCAEALAEFEPLPAWSEPFLRSRYECYEALGHPRARQAQADLEAFYAASSVPLWRGLQTEDEQAPAAIDSIDSIDSIEAAAPTGASAPADGF